MHYTNPLINDNDVDEKSSKTVEGNLLDNEKAYQAESQQNTFSGFITVLNLLNSFLGSLITNNSYSFEGAGFVGTILVLMIFGAISYGTSYIILKLANETKTNGINQLTNEILGRVGSIIYSILSIFYLFYCLTNYLAVAGNILFLWFEIGG